MTKRIAGFGLFTLARMAQGLARPLLLALSLLWLGLLWAMPLPAATPSCDLDIDDNGTTAAGTDAQLLLRHLFGFADTTLTQGVLGAGCTRCDANAISTHLESLACQVLFDVDGDGRRDALSDGLLVWRHLSGYTGSALIEGALADGAQRAEPEALVSWLSRAVQPTGEAPKRVELVAADSLQGTTIDLAWLTTQDNDTPVDQLRYVLHADTSPGFVPSAATANTEVLDQAHGTLVGLTPDTLYSVKVEAIDRAGNHSWSNELAVRTAVDRPVETGAAHVVLDDSNTADLQVDPDSISYRLPPGARPPAIGDIITSPLGDGFLRRVTGIDRAGDRISLQTESADLASLFADLQLSSDLKLIDAPDTQTLAGTAAARSLDASQSPGERRLHWPERGLTVIQQTLPSALGAPVTAAGAVTGGGCDGSGSNETITDVPLMLTAPSGLCIEPGSALRVSVAAAIAAGSTADWQITQLQFTGLTHPTLSGSPGFGAIWVPPGPGGDTEGNGHLDWIPDSRHVDTDNRPFRAGFIALARKRTCGLLEFDCTRRVEVAVPIYIAWGELPRQIQESFDAGTSLRITGTTRVDFQPRINIAVDLGNSGLRAAKVRLDGPLAFRTQVRLNASANGNYSYQQDLLNKRFVRVFWAGSVPIIVTGQLKLQAQLRANANAALDITQTLDLGYDLTAGLSYNQGNWQVLGEATPWQRYQLRGEADTAAAVEVRFVPDFTLAFYDVASGRLLVEPYLYGQTALEGQFAYSAASGNSGSDADYRFIDLEFGGGIDGRFRLGLEVLNRQVAGYPSRNPAELHAFDILSETPILGLPTLTPQATGVFQPLGDVPEQVCALGLDATTEDVPHPFGGADSLNPFVADSAGWKVVARDGDPGLLTGSETLQPGDTPNAAWFVAEEAGRYTLRFGGHSALGSYIRQYEEIEVDYDPNSSACNCGGLISGRYLPIGEDCGIIRDVVNGLDWQRCFAGLKWYPEKNYCSNEPGYRAFSGTWDQAMELTSPGGFRLPTIGELRSLVYCSTGRPALFGMPYNGMPCEGAYEQPAVVSEAFSMHNTETLFWSSSLLPSTPGVQRRAWGVFFLNGAVYSDYITKKAFARLVRPARP